jgi:hypothetical protein
MKIKKFKDLYNLEDWRKLYLGWLEKYPEKLFVIIENGKNANVAYFSEM